MVNRRAFSLPEMLAVCAIISILASPVLVSAATLIRKYSDPLSEYNIERSVEDTVAWLNSIIERSLLEKRDFIIEINPQKTSRTLKAKFTGPTETVEHKSRNLAYRINGGLNAPQNYHHSHLYQTMSPAFELTVFAWSEADDLYTNTDRSIIVSVYGLVRHKKNLR